jgi:hypothetical protein
MNRGNFSQLFLIDVQESRAALIWAALEDQDLHLTWQSSAKIN